jgi:hypothetical protein
MPHPTVAERLRKGAEALTELAGQAREVEGRLDDALSDAAEAREREIELERELYEIEDATPLREDLEDVLRGTFTLAEICDRYEIGQHIYTRPMRSL